MRYSRHAPQAPEGKGTSPSNPFVRASITSCYTLLDALYMQTAEGKIKVRYTRIGPLEVAGFSHPVDHYGLYDDSDKQDGKLGKLMDFYMYGWGDSNTPMSELPAGLGDMTSGDPELERSMEKLTECLDSDPKFKEMKEKFQLMQINMARMQRGLPPLKSLDEARSCLVGVIALAGGGAGLLGLLAHLLT